MGWVMLRSIFYVQQAGTIRLIIIDAAADPLVAKIRVTDGQQYLDKLCAQPMNLKYPIWNLRGFIQLEFLELLLPLLLESVILSVGSSSYGLLLY